MKKYLYLIKKAKIKSWLKFWLLKKEKDYVEVEYIESSGTQYIDTGYIPNNTTKVVIQASTKGQSLKTALFGSRKQDSTNNFLSFIEKYYDGNNNSIRIDIGGIGGNTGKYWVVDEPFTINIDCLNKKVLINNEEIQKYNGFNYSTSDVDLSLFSIKSGTQHIYSIAGRIYFFKIYENDILIHNFIPCYLKVNNEIGMYDTITNTFFGNDGTGTFVKGNDK